MFSKITALLFLSFAPMVFGCLTTVDGSASNTDARSVNVEDLATVQPLVDVDGPLGAARQPYTETDQCCYPPGQPPRCMKKVCVVGMESRGCDANYNPYVTCIHPLGIF